MPGINVNAKDKYGSTSIGFAQDLASNSGLGYPLGDDERQQWQDVVTIIDLLRNKEINVKFSLGGIKTYPMCDFASLQRSKQENF